MGSSHGPAQVQDPLISTLEPAFRAGAISGQSRFIPRTAKLPLHPGSSPSRLIVDAHRQRAAGFLFGGAAGILRGAPLFLFASASGLQTFVLGTSFSGCRSGVLQAWQTGSQEPSPSELVKASAIAGAFAGSANGLIFRGRSNVLPGAIMFAIFGAGGQYIYDRCTTPRIKEAPQPDFFKRMTEASWSPVKIMSNEEYAEMLREKALKVEVEIALIDDRISALKAQELKEASAPISVEPTAKK